MGRLKRHAGATLQRSQLGPASACDLFESGIRQVAYKGIVNRLCGGNVGGTGAITTPSLCHTPPVKRCCTLRIDL